MMRIVDLPVPESPNGKEVLIPGVQVLIDVASAGYRYSVMWTVDCLGWKGLPPSDVAARCENALQPGAILLMHVGAASTDNAALEDIVAAIA